MRQLSALLLLCAAIGITAPLGAAGFLEPVQAQNQAPPPEGFRIIGNIYWVGGEYGSYLITTPQGHILHDTGTNEMHDVIVSNVKKLGFDVRDIKMIISSHAHFDHVQGHAAMKKLTGAQVIALGGDGLVSRGERFGWRVGCECGGAADLRGCGARGDCRWADAGVEGAVPAGVDGVAGVARGGDFARGGEGVKAEGAGGVFRQD